MAILTEVKSETGFDQTIKNAPSSTLFVLYFHTPWAAPCAQMNTILTTLASTYPANADISFLSINAEDLPDVSESYDVTAVPFLVLQKDGKTLETVSGSDAAKVRAVVEKYAGTGSGAGKTGIPPPLEAAPQSHTQTNGDAPTASKDLSGYAPKPSDPQAAPAYSSGLDSREELNERLAKLVKAAPVMLFMKGTPSAPQCGFSRQLVSILRENQVKYGFFNILADNDVREGLKAFSDWPTFPQLYTNGELVGGLDIVREELEADPDFFKPYSAAVPKPDAQPAPTPA
ncbi:Grx4 family monothiol glutaredoxin [Rhinocladiella mackenziei CBS 650.93]|uniref:Grx4 family monothiol glutaredoxin n=1 Tax=Rhinocladiella mackenziei CBS 650.93 TaxID=1442369 RepID=A0A0D2IG67_9EURO|nr:Grx4 family monothiol glutaredoxin [Rhinocladiella mackenziei CBS 650.93]KIX02266.1 Grx4 family monothiol glutaredoxin [Rhinocladiella mackenziei CBS 650.93]